MLQSAETVRPPGPNYTLPECSNDINDISDHLLLTVCADSGKSSLLLRLLYVSTLF